MRLLTLRLENFKGIRSLSLDFNGENADIYGTNATGKSTVYDAFTWLLFNRASTDEKGFSPKTTDQDGEDLHYLDHSVEGVFELDDGRLLTLKKIYHETYKKVRGSANKEFTGHTTDYYIDGVPAKESEYTVTLLDIFDDVERMRMLCQHGYFPKDMPWEARRRILLDICGDIDDEDVIASSDELEELPGRLLKPGSTNGQLYTVDEYKKIAAAKKTDINKQLQIIPGRIDEAQRAIPDTDGLDMDVIKLKIKELSDEYRQVASEKAAVQSGDTAAAAVRTQIAELNAKLAEARAAHADNEGRYNADVYADISKINESRHAKERFIDEKKSELDKKESQLTHLQQRRQELLDSYNVVQAQSWDEGQAVCPTCNRELPEEDVARMREEFNLSKSKKLQEINETGGREASKDMIEQTQAEINAFALIITEEEAKLKKMDAQISQFEAKINGYAPFENTDEYKQLTSEIAALRDKESDTGEAVSEAVKFFEEKLEYIAVEGKSWQAKQTALELAETQQQRIDELMAEEKTLTAEYEQLEKSVYLCELFIKTKVRLLDDRINSKFSNVRFRLFQEQINGGLKDCCDVMIPSANGSLVAFAPANTGGQINAGLEIIDVLSAHWGMSLPVWIDGCESIVHPIEIAPQVIRLHVSAEDEVLRMELDNVKDSTKREEVGVAC